MIFRESSARNCLLLIVYKSREMMINFRRKTTITLSVSWDQMLMWWRSTGTRVNHQITATVTSKCFYIYIDCTARLRLHKRPAGSSSVTSDPSTCEAKCWRLAVARGVCWSLLGRQNQSWWHHWINRSEKLVSDWLGHLWSCGEEEVLKQTPSWTILTNLSTTRWQCWASVITLHFSVMQVLLY